MMEHAWGPGTFCCQRGGGKVVDDWGKGLRRESAETIAPN